MSILINVQQIIVLTQKYNVIVIKYIRSKGFANPRIITLYDDKNPLSRYAVFHMKLIGDYKPQRHEAHLLPSTRAEV
jgi:hypothetical protein